LVLFSKKKTFLFYLARAAPLGQIIPLPWRL